MLGLGRHVRVSYHGRIPKKKRAIALLCLGAVLGVSLLGKLPNCLPDGACAPPHSGRGASRGASTVDHGGNFSRRLTYICTARDAMILVDARYGYLVAPPAMGAADRDKNPKVRSLGERQTRPTSRDTFDYYSKATP